MVWDDGCWEGVVGRNGSGSENGKSKSGRREDVGGGMRGSGIRGANLFLCDLKGYLWAGIRLDSKHDGRLCAALLGLGWTILYCIVLYCVEYLFHLYKVMAESTTGWPLISNQSLS